MNHKIFLLHYDHHIRNTDLLEGMNVRERKARKRSMSSSNSFRGRIRITVSLLRERFRMPNVREQTTIRQPDKRTIEKMMGLSL